jgi:hypothetical protein
VDVVRWGSCSGPQGEGSGSRASANAAASSPFVHREGKATMVDAIVEPCRGRASGGFMVGARRSAVPGHGGVPPAEDVERPFTAFQAAVDAPGAPRTELAAASDGRQVIARRKKWRRLPRRPSPPLLQRPVPTDLVGKCFNCLCPGHVTVSCTNVVHCLRCHREGHQARSCKSPRSPDAGGPPPRPSKLTLVVVIQPGRGSVALAKSAP